MPTYIVDSNFFIQAHRVLYPLDIAESFWQLVSRLANEGVIVSIDKVKHELYQNDDELRRWCEGNLPHGFFADSSECITQYGEVVSWAVTKSDHYLQKALDEFLDADEADAWIIAFAKMKGFMITTYEVSQPERKNKVKIPEPCISFGLPFRTTIEMFREIGVKF
ncbi:DUF4411 family protein [Owenweeksia hongkongensis]|uniref:DUF4411 family protein n=1 Tax=Owenweeksia hongkongensis TaxID=253245 RepID=UPI003A95AA45